MYKKIDVGVVETLRQIVGQDDVLVSAEALEPFAHDEVVGLRANPEVVVCVTSAAQVSEIFKLAQRERKPQRHMYQPNQHRRLDSAGLG